MAITRGNTLSEAPSDGNPSPFTTSGTLAVNAGESVVIFVRGDGASGRHQDVTAISDSVAGAYTLVDEIETPDPQLYAYYYLNHPGGTVTFTITFNNATDGTRFMWIWAGAYAGVKTSAALDSAASDLEARSVASTTDFTTSTFSTAENDSVIIIAATPNGTATFTAGSGFTLRDGNLDGTGGVEDQILTGAWTTTAAHITSNTAYTAFQMGRVVLKSAAAGTSSGNPLLMMGVR